MNNYEQQYLALLKRVKETGVYSKNRTGINTYKVWGAQININLQDGFPLLTTKKMHWKSVVHELLWMIKGDTNIQYLLKNGVTFWTEWPFQKYQNEKPKLGGLMLVDPILLTNQEKEFQKGKSFGDEIDNLLKKSISEKMKLFEQTIISNDEFAKKWGGIGEYGYGGMWRQFPAREWRYGLDLSYEEDNIKIDQLSNAINELKTNPDSRRIIITAWHPYHSNRKEDALLPACHNYIQFGTEELTLEERANLYLKKSTSQNGITIMPPEPMEIEFDKLNIPKHRLNCYFNMRSNDAPLGLPYNIAFYALFTHLMARTLNMIPNQLVYTAADVHIYENQLDGINEQLSRTPGKLPELGFSRSFPSNIFDVQYNDVEIFDYNPQSHIKMPVAV